jgi:hypothetical protein
MKRRACSQQRTTTTYEVQQLRARRSLARVVVGVTLGLCSFASAQAQTAGKDADVRPPHVLADGTSPMIVHFAFKGQASDTQTLVRILERLKNTVSFLPGWEQTIYRFSADSVQQRYLLHAIVRDSRGKIGHELYVLGASAGSRAASPPFTTPILDSDTRITILDCDADRLADVVLCEGGASAPGAQGTLLRLGFRKGRWYGITTAGGGCAKCAA